MTLPWHFPGRFGSLGWHEHRRWAHLALIGYLLLAGSIAWLGRHQINPDATAYIGMARHLAEGKPGMAVNSWWSPGFPILLVPGVVAGVEPLLWSRLMQIPAGILLAFGVATLIHRFQSAPGSAGRLTSGGTLAGFLLALAASLTMQTRMVTPDVWHAGILIWYWVAAHTLLHSGTVGRAVLTGVLGGIAYWIKAFSFPFVLAHLSMTFGLILWSGKKSGAVRRSAVLFFTAIVAFGAVSGPWIATISRHDREWTMSSAGKYWTVAQPLDAAQVPPITKLFAVEPGRLSVLEDIRGLPLEWKPAPPAGFLHDWRAPLKAMRRNVAGILRGLDDLDGIGLTKALLLFGGLGLGVRMVSRPKRVDQSGRAEVSSADGGSDVAAPGDGAPADRSVLVSSTWGYLSIGIYLAGYALVYFEARFLWAIWGMLIVLCVVAPAAVLGASTGMDRQAGQQLPGAIGTQCHGWALVLMGVLCLGITASTAAAGLLGNSSRVSRGLKAAAGQLPADLPMTATDWQAGLSVAYWANSRFLGSPEGATPDAIERELRPLGESVLLVMQEPELVHALQSHSAFKDLKVGSAFVAAFQYRPAAAPGRGGR